jgi:hypothetical protein
MKRRGRTRNGKRKMSKAALLNQTQINMPENLSITFIAYLLVKLKDGVWDMKCEIKTYQLRDSKHLGRSGEPKDNISPTFSPTCVLFPPKFVKKRSL